MQKISAKELRRLYVDFFVKKHGHKEIPGASLIPENDPTVLFTTAGMHPLVPFLMGEKHPSGTRLVNAQKCLRTDDIDEVGDQSHLTFFEMLGNWSLGDYFKKEAIEMSFEFLTSPRKKGGLGLPLNMLAVTCFEGDKDAPRDEESSRVWLGLGVPEGRIAFLPKKANWWGPAGQTGPCGPDTEMFFWSGVSRQGGADEPAPEKFDPNDPRWVEIWNDVFMQYFKNKDESYSELKQKNVDTGMGFERVLAVMNGMKTPFETELFKDAIDELRALGGYDIGAASPDDEKIRAERIICDHLRAAAFLLGDVHGVVPSNVDQGYVLRKLIRRAVRHGGKLEINGDFTRKIAGIFVRLYGEAYPELVDNQGKIFDEIAREETQFAKTLLRGEHIFKNSIAVPLGILKDTYVKLLKERNIENAEKFLKNALKLKDFISVTADISSSLEKIWELDTFSINNLSKSDVIRLCNLIERHPISPVTFWLRSDKAFWFYETFGLPEEILRDMSEDAGLAGVDEKGFRDALKAHQSQSRVGAEQKFSGGLADHSEQVTKLHTATHLLHAALRKVLGEHVEQKGSNITAERLRFDFIHGDKMTPEQVAEVEKIVNEQIKADSPVHCEEMTVEEAKKKGAVGLFESKYGDKVKVYTIGKDTSAFFSKEICGGPHATHTGELGGFKILKEESSSRGVRRIKGVIG